MTGVVAAPPSGGGSTISGSRLGPGSMTPPVRDSSSLKVSLCGASAGGGSPIGRSGSIFSGTTSGEPTGGGSAGTAGWAWTAVAAARLAKMAATTKGGLMQAWVNSLSCAQG